MLRILALTPPSPQGTRERMLYRWPRRLILMPRAWEHLSVKACSSIFNKKFTAVQLACNPAREENGGLTAILGPPLQSNGQQSSQVQRYSGAHNDPLVLPIGRRWSQSRTMSSLGKGGLMILANLLKGECILEERSVLLVSTPAMLQKRPFSGPVTTTQR